MGRKWRWLKDWADEFLADPRIMSLDFLGKGVYVTLASLLRTQKMDEPGRFVMNGQRLSLRDIRLLVRKYEGSSRSGFEPIEGLNGDYNRSKQNLNGTYDEPSPGPNEQPKSARSRATSEGMRLYHAMRKIIELGLLRQDEDGAYYSPEVVKSIQESEAAARSAQHRGNNYGDRSGDRPDDLEKSKNKKKGIEGTPIDKLPESYEPPPEKNDSESTF